jgi:hypothetical protein
MEAIFANSLARATLKLAFLAKLVSSALGFRRISESSSVAVLAWLFAFGTTRVQSKSLPLVLALLHFPNFRLGVGRPDADEVTPWEHLTRFLTFRKADLKLAPSPPLYKVFQNVVCHGILERHLQERNLFQLMQSAYRFYIPLQRFDRTKIATMVNFVTDPVDVEHVLGDKAAFPTRGHTGFSVRLEKCYEGK